MGAPPELETRSLPYWYGSHGYSGGYTANAFAGIQSALSGAFIRPGSGGGGGSLVGAQFHPGAPHLAGVPV